MRALGASWRQVAEALDRSESTVRQWPIVHRSLWDAESEAANQEVLDEAGGEAVRALRLMIRAIEPGNDLFGHLGMSTRAGISWRAANTVAYTLMRLHQSRTKAAGSKGAASESDSSEFDDWSIEELVEEADRQGVPVPDVLRNRIAGENPEAN